MHVEDSRCVCLRTGWDKTYCLRYLPEGDFDEIHFFGDKTLLATVVFLCLAREVSCKAASGIQTVMPSMSSAN